MTRAECALNAIQRERQISHGGFDLFVDEIQSVHDVRTGNVYGFGVDMFLLGFAKGRRAEKAAQKKRRREQKK